MCGTDFGKIPVSVSGLGFRVQGLGIDLGHIPV